MRSRIALSGCDFTVLGFQELLNGRIDCERESFHVVDRDVPFAALNRTDICAMQVGFFSEVFLRNAQPFSMPPQILTEDLSNVSLAAHEFMLDSMMPLRLQT